MVRSERTLAANTKWQRDVASDCAKRCLEPLRPPGRGACDCPITGYGKGGFTRRRGNANGNTKSFYRSERKEHINVEKIWDRIDGMSGRRMRTRGTVMLLAIKEFSRGDAEARRKKWKGIGTVRYAQPKFPSAVHFPFLRLSPNDFFGSWRAEILSITLRQTARRRKWHRREWYDNNWPRGRR
jgi:hypothetical protein